MLKFVILGLSITSSWGNGHATTYRGLVKGLAARGHKVLFLEREVPWYARNRDLVRSPYFQIELYKTLSDLKGRFTKEIRSADFVMVGSYVPEGIAVGEWVLNNASGVTAFYDIDTPVTLARLDQSPYISRELIRRYQLYLSFTGGPILEELEKRYGSPMARAFYCSVDPELYFPEEIKVRWDLGYLGTYSPDRQPALERLLFRPALCCKNAKFIVAGPQYPDSITWPANVDRVEHLPPSRHRKFYNQQRYTLNLTRGDMRRAGFSPSVRLFEAAACATPIITDNWPGLATIFKPGEQIVVAHISEDVLKILCSLSDSQRNALGQAARQCVLAKHTAAHRAAELEGYAFELLGTS